MKPGAGWPIGIALILATSVAGNLGVIYFTRDDPSFAVEPDYYRKAVVWDSSQVAEDASDALDWSVQATTHKQRDGSTTLELVLLDGAGVALHGASVTGELLHVARANEVQTITFHETTAGQYVARPNMSRVGLWELRLLADRIVPGAASQHFMHTLRLDTDNRVPIADPAP